MTTILCTLYNSLYLDKGLVLYDSLCECAKDFRLYVLCMDDKCYEVLTDLHQKHQIPVRLSDFEKGDEDLLIAKGNRPIGEYCWTCSSSFIRYVLNHFQESICTYIDADMYFYNDPQILIDEMEFACKSAMVVPHRFPPKNIKLAEKYGSYCVEFNTFKNNEEGLTALEYWRGRCLECCKNIGDGIHWGDQKYLDELVEKFDAVYVCQNKGAGVAPWNIIQYSRSSQNVSSLLFYNPLSIEIPLVFYHFQAIMYVTREIVKTGFSSSSGIDFNLVDQLYYPYLKKIEKKKKFLESHYDIRHELIKHHPAEKKPSIWQKIQPRSIYSSFLNYIMHSHPYIINIGN